MMPGDEAAQAVEQAMQDTADATTTATTHVAAEMEGTAAAVADQAETVNQEGFKAASKVVGGTAEAFDAAREQLNAMAGSLPPEGQELLRPFQLGGTAMGKGLQSSYASTMEGMAEFNSKAIAAWRSNAESALRHWQSLTSVKSLSEAIALNAEHTRRQLEALTSQTRELSALATRIVRDAADPLKMTGR